MIHCELSLSTIGTTFYECAHNLILILFRSRFLTPQIEHSYAIIIHRPLETYGSRAFLKVSSDFCLIRISYFRTVTWLQLKLSEWQNDLSPTIPLSTQKYFFFLAQQEYQLFDYFQYLSLLPTTISCCPCFKLDD